MTATYTVPSSGTYTSARTGGRYRYPAGAVIAMASAVDLGMPGAALDADVAPFTDAQLAYLAATFADDDTAAPIHNYFPDGAVTNAALIDTLNAEDYDVKLWQDAAGTETLALQAAGGGNPAAVKVSVLGNSFGEGVKFGDYTNRYGGFVPAGLIRVGFTIWSDLGGGSTIIPMHANLGLDHPGEYGPQLDFTIDGNVRRCIVEGYNLAYGTWSVTIATRDPGGGASAAPLSFYVANVMASDGNPVDFRDGDAAGWTWSGDAYGSPSSGPQP